MSYKGEQDPSLKGRDIVVTGTTLTQPIQHSAFFNNSNVPSSAKKVKESDVNGQLRGYDVDLSPSRRPIASALKRTGSERSNTPRKSVSFVLPDASPRSSQENDFYYPDDIDEVSVPIDAIAAAQNKAPAPVSAAKASVGYSIPQTAPTSFNVPTRAPVETTRRAQTVKLNLFQAPTMPPETTSEKLPNITREPLKFVPASSEPPQPATFTSLRSKLRGMAPVRVRANRPPSEPLKICLHCKGSLITHYELKKAADQAIHYFKDAHVTGLQFDPLAIWSGDPAAVSRWIIALSDSDACHYLTRTGLNVHGEHYQVDFYDDILLDEYEVYKMKQSILQAGKRKPTQTA